MPIPFGTRHHISHGAANAVIFPHILANNAPVVPEKTRLVLEALGLSASTDPAEVSRLAGGWCASLGIEMRMRARGVPESDLGAMADEAFAIKRLIDNNPRALTRAAIIEILQPSLLRENARDQR